MGAGSAPWLPVLEVAGAGYLSGEVPGRFGLVTIWGTAPFPAWLLVQQEEAVLALNLVAGCKKTLLIFGGVH